MNPTGKKFLSLFLVLSLMVLSVNLYAKERRGAKLEIWGTGDRYIKGELIAVKQNSLLLLNTEGKDVSIDIANIEVVRIEKKSKALLGAGIGLLILGGGSALIGLLSEEYYPELAAIVYGLVGAVVGALIGAGIGALSGKYETIWFEGKSQKEINKILMKLRRYARIRDYK